MKSNGSFAEVFGEVDDQVDHRLHLFVAEDDRAQHFFFGQLVGLGFHHHHGVFGAGDDQVKPLLGLHAQLRHVVHRGVQHVLAARQSRRAPRRSGP